LDSSAKIRTEIETRLVGAAAAEQIKQSFLGIGFVSVASVEKTRETMHLRWQNQQVEACLDSVTDVGDFVELEIVVENPQQKEQAKSALESLAAKLELSGSILTSYLGLLLQRRGDI
jgi:adenylate cyclase class 2